MLDWLLVTWGYQTRDRLPGGVIGGGLDVDVVLRRCHITILVDRRIQGCASGAPVICKKNFEIDREFRMVYLYLVELYSERETVDRSLFCDLIWNKFAGSQLA
jgi:hypothetical protein